MSACAPSINDLMSACACALSVERLVDLRTGGSAPHLFISVKCARVDDNVRRDGGEPHIFKDSKVIPSPVLPYRISNPPPAVRRTAVKVFSLLTVSRKLASEIVVVAVFN